MKQDKVLGLLGLARKAGRIKSGSEQTIEAIRSGQVRAALIAGDASAGTKKQLLDKCRYRKVPCAFYADMETLGSSIGSGPRSVVAVCDEGFARAVLKELGMNDLM